MTNQDENKNRQYINSGVSFNSILYMDILFECDRGKMTRWFTFAQFFTKNFFS